MLFAAQKTSAFLFVEVAKTERVPRVYLSIGSNLEPVRNIRLAVNALQERFAPVDISPIYRNKAIGFSGEDFLNLVVGFDANVSVSDMCQQISSIHELAQRARDDDKYSSRTLDIDLLLYGQLVTDGPPLKLPRIDVLQYAFTLKPLADIAADQRHPETGKTFAEHWSSMDQNKHPLTPVDIDLTSPGSDHHRSQ